MLPAGRTGDHKEIDGYQHRYYRPSDGDPECQKEQAMSIAPERRPRKPIQDTPALAGRWLIDPLASHARFLAGTLGGLVKTAGRFGSLSGNLVVDETHAVGALLIDSSSIDTGNRLRDQHLRSRAFFGVKRHPQIRYEAHSISSELSGSTRIDGELIVAHTCTPLALDVRVHAPTDGVVELTCDTEVDRVALGLRSARGMVPRMVRLNVAITLRKAIT
jgi:polyisoprenoid-binding protein YceI